MGNLVGRGLCSCDCRCIDAILLDAIVARPLVFGRDGKVFYGDEARGIGMRRLIGGVGLLVLALLASIIVFAQ